MGAIPPDETEISLVISKKNILMFAQFYWN
jgi:hypothetical protein